MKVTGKKFAALFLAVVMAASLLAGCGASSSGGAESAGSSPSGSASSAASGSSETTKWTADSVKGALKGVTLVVATSGTYGPFSYFDSDGKTLIGYDLDLLSALQDYLGFTMSTTQPTTMTYAALVSSLTEGKVDMVLAGLGVTDERKQVMNFSDPYYSDGLCVIVNSKTNPGIQSFNDLKSGKYKVAVESGTVAHTYVSTPLPESCVEVHDSITTAYESLSAGKVDAVIELRAGAMYHKNTTGDATMEIVGDNITSKDYAIGVSFDVCKRVDGFTDIINAALEHLNQDGTLKKLNDKWCA